jgi:hypothetical protein
VPPSSSWRRRARREATDAVLNRLGKPHPGAQTVETMTVYGQLDSGGDKVTIADVGMVYVFACFDCPRLGVFFSPDDLSQEGRNEHIFQA